MRLDKRYSKLVKAIPHHNSNEVHQAPAIAHAGLDTARSVLAVTDGHYLIEVPVTDIEADTSGPLTAEALSTAVKQTPKSIDHVDVKANGSIVTRDGSSFARPDTKFPIYTRVLEKAPKRGERGTLTFGIDAKFLALVAASLGSDRVAITVSIEDREKSVTVEAVHGDMKSDTRFDNSGAVGIIMPVYL